MVDLRRFFKVLNVVLTVLVLAMAAPAGADDKVQLQQAITAYQAGDYNQAFKLFQPLAQQGDALAQNNLGVMYENGQGVAPRARRSAKLPARLRLVSKGSQSRIC